MGELPIINLNILGAADYTGYLPIGYTEWGLGAANYTGYPPIGYTEWGTRYPARDLIFIVKIVT